MPKETPHIVHRQILEAKLPTEAAALEFHQKISRLYETELPRLLERLFDELDLGDDLLHIPRLEIDIGSLPPEGWEQAFVERCAEHIGRALNKKKHQAIALNTPALLREPPKEDRLVPKNQQVLLSFFEFLRSGTLKSREIAADLEQFEKDIVKAFRESKPQRKKLRNYWSDLTRRNERVTERLVKQFSLPFIREVVKLIWEMNATQWESLWKAFQRLAAEADGRSTVTRNQQNYWFSSTVMRSLPQHDLPFDFTKVQTECIADWEQLLGIMDSIGDTAIISSSSGRQEKRGEEPKHTGEQQSDEHFPAEEESAPQPDYFIENGGLVIVAPFLPTLFRELKLSDGQEFIDPDRQEKAIHLTQYLATGEEQSPEFLLPLNKLLCGWPLGKPLIREIDLNQAEKEEAEDMLRAVIKHWGKIGKSSVAALRETFLQRKATLRYRTGYQDWHLHVERKSGIDILVERIPWAITMIKLPWMPERIQVEWV